MKNNLTPFQEQFKARIISSRNLGANETDFQSNADELIGRISNVITVMTTKGDGIFKDQEVILEFLLQLQVEINKSKLANNPELLILNLFKNELECLKAFRYVSKIALEIHGICEGDNSGALSTLWEIQELVNFPILEEKGDAA